MAKTTTYNINSSKRMTVYEEYSGGINASDDETKIDEIELGNRTKNIELTPRGVIRKRSGLKYFKTDFEHQDAYVDALFPYLLNGERFIIKAVSNMPTISEKTFLVVTNGESDSILVNDKNDNLVELESPIRFIEDISSNYIYVIDKLNIHVFDKTKNQLNPLEPRDVTP